METPCIKVCVVNPETRLCSGCGRTLAEIASWASLSAAERRRIMRELPLRLAAEKADRAAAGGAQ